MTHHIVDNDPAILWLLKLLPSNLKSRQFLKFVLVGLAQFFIDAILFLAIFKVTQEVVISNIAAKGLAALSGYFLNRRFTFDLAKDHAHGTRLSRLFALWAGLSILSTLMLAGWQHASLHLGVANLDAAMALGKFSVEAMLVLISFNIAKCWVYRR